MEVREATQIYIKYKLFLSPSSPRLNFDKKLTKKEFKKVLSKLIPLTEQKLLEFVNHYSRVLVHAEGFKFK